MEQLDPIYGRDTLVDLDGQVCVLHEIPLSSRPRIVRMWWPTGTRTCQLTDNNQALLGARLRHGRFSEDGYTIADGKRPDLTIHLKDRGRTEAIKVEEFAAPPPPAKLVRGKSLRWYNGQWERLLATGWYAVGVWY